MVSTDYKTWSFRLFYVFCLYMYWCNCFLLFFNAYSFWRMFCLQECSTSPGSKQLTYLTFGALLLLMVDFDATLVQVFSLLLLFVTFRTSQIISCFSSNSLTNSPFPIFSCSVSFFIFSISLFAALSFETSTLPL